MSSLVWCHGTFAILVMYIFFYTFIINTQIVKIKYTHKYLAVFHLKSNHVMLMILIHTLGNSAHVNLKIIVFQSREESSGRERLNMLEAFGSGCC